MSDTDSGLTYTIEESAGMWFQLWWNGQECVYSEDLTAKIRLDAEREAAANVSSGSPLERIMAAMGCVSAQPEAGRKGEQPRHAGTGRGTK